MKWFKDTKYHAKKVIVDGITFDSKKEAQRYLDLKMLEKCNVIKNLQRQVEYVLVPNQYADCEEYITRGVNKGAKKQGKLLERQVVYKADFVYEKGKETVIEDVKGIKTKEYIIKRKLMLYVYGIKITEI